MEGGPIIKLKLAAAPPSDLPSLSFSMRLTLYVTPIAALSIKIRHLWAPSLFHEAHHDVTRGP